MSDGWRKHTDAAGREWSLRNINGEMLYWTHDDKTDGHQTTIDGKTITSALTDTTIDDFIHGKGENMSNFGNSTDGQG
ncbi:MAG: hypothetical protein WC455_12120 [Dehalococcoidia bacterium]|jgi:hypothetical protein